jgi:hypothetical protein
LLSKFFTSASKQKIPRTELVTCQKKNFHHVKATFK